MTNNLTPIEHGTINGFKKHQKRKDPKCQSCWDARAEYMREYRKTHPETMAAAYKRKWDRADKELARKNSLAWRHKNLDHANEYQRNLRKDNPRWLELHNATSRRRRSRIRNQGFEFFTETDVINKYGNICHLCQNEIDLSAPRGGRSSGALELGWKNGLHIDHVIPISQGGSDTLDNVRPSHAMCNLKKGSNIIESSTND